MSVVSVKARSFILALFIRDDGERFLLGDNGYDFKDSQLHFAANTIENDEVMKQGADGVMVAGQVRRASVQSFDGFVGDATMAKETIEQMRRDFFAFFVKGHHFRVVYIDCNRNAWQRKGGYLVDAPEVKELWQIHPEYHVGLNFEDVNYYSYDEDSDGEEILSNLVDVPVSTAASGGLVWDEDGAVSEDAEVEYDTETAVATPAKNVYITDAAEAPLASFQLDGETSQNGTPTPSAPVPVQTVTGENVVKISDGQGNEQSYTIDLGEIIELDMSQATRLDAYISGAGVIVSSDSNALFGIAVEPNTTYTITKIASSRFRYVCTSTTPAIGATVGTTTNNDSATSVTVTTGASDTYIVCAYWSSTSTSTKDDVFNSVKITTGNSIELCKIGTYQDYIYKSGGKWKIYKVIAKAVIDGASGTWSKPSTNRFNVDRLITGYKKQNALFNAFCDRYIALGESNDNAGFNTAAADYSYAMNFTPSDSWNTVRFKNTDYDDLDDFKTHLGSNPATIYYILATPTDTEITNEALITQLEALLNTARTYAGTNNIFTVTPNEQGTLEISYYTKYQPMVVSGGYVLEAGGAGGATIVVNNSIDNVNPIWKIYGPTMNPQLENSTTGEVIEYVGLIAEGQTLTIDMGEQTASLDGLNVISNLVGDFISLAPGANRLIYSVSGDAGASEIGWSEIVG